MNTLTEIKARAVTDYWRKPPSIDVADAPTARTITVNSEHFRSARVTVSADWTRLYDQGGVLVQLPGIVAQNKRCWVKAGIEFVGGRSNLSVVAAREWADWSVIPIPTPAASITIDLAREPVDASKGTGSSLLVYVVEQGRRVEYPIREVTWAFEQEGEISIGLYAARPTKVEGDDSELVVKFETFVVEDSAQD